VFIRAVEQTGGRLARLELSQLRLDFLDVSSVPFSNPSLGTGAPYLSGVDGHAAALSRDGGLSRNVRNVGFHQGGEDEFGWDGFTESTVDLVHLLALRVRRLFLVVKGIGGGGHRTHGEIIEGRKGRRGAELSLPDTMVIGGDDHRIKMEDERGRTVGVFGAARHGREMGGGQIHRRWRHVAWK